MSDNGFSEESNGSRLLPAEVPDDTDDHHYVPAPCQVACPVGTDAPSYIAYIWEKKLPEAFEAITATNPFSSICGRVCDAPCEPACRRVQADGPLQIRNLKRFVMDEVGNSLDPPPIPVTRKETVAIVGSGPAGLVAAHDLSVAGFEVHVYEMTDRLGGMMIWGIPAFRLPPSVIVEDIERLKRRCPELKIHLNTALGADISLEELKSRHAAVVLAIGSWWGKQLDIPGGDHPSVLDGVQFLRDVNEGARPEMPETVVVIGGGDVAMDACRVAKRLPGCKTVKVIYRRGPEEIPARKIELEGAVKEGIEFIYNTQQVALESEGNQLSLTCIQTGLGEADEDGRRRPVDIPGSEHKIDCGMIIASIGQEGKCAHLDDKGMMLSDRVQTEWETMLTDETGVFACGDGAFGGSTIVMAMHHGQRVAYYVKAFLEGHTNPLPYRQPFRTRRVPLAQDLEWEKLPVQEPEFHGLGKNPIEFPEIEDTYGGSDAFKEAARCYRCDAETGTADYAVRHREDIFAMARTNPLDEKGHKRMLERRLSPRENPFPEGRKATLDDLTFLPANLTRLVIDPYREACRLDTELGSGRLKLDKPFFVTGFDDAPDQVRVGVAEGLIESNTPYIGMRSIGNDVPWLQLVVPEQIAPNREALGHIFTVSHQFAPIEYKRMSEGHIIGLSVSAPELLPEVIPYSLENGFDFLILDGSRSLSSPWAELAGEPDLTILRDAVSVLRDLRREEGIGLIYFGGVRSGTDAAKVVALGGTAVVLGVTLALAVGGEINECSNIRFSMNRSDAERSGAVKNILNASAQEASMMARCTGKTNLHNVEPEDLRAITKVTAMATGVPLAGTV